jgi:hypothetical protein
MTISSFAGSNEYLNADHEERPDHDADNKEEAALHPVPRT